MRKIGTDLDHVGCYPQYPKEALSVAALQVYFQSTVWYGMVGTTYAPSHSTRL